MSGPAPGADTVAEAGRTDAANKTVLVTGASRGIGLAIARVLAADGYRVVALARREGEALAAMRQGGAEIHFMPFDLEAIAAIPAFFAELRASCGPLYGLVNNAAIGTEGLLATMPTPAIERLVRLNTLAPLVVTKHAVRSMMSAGSGRVVNVASVIASTGYAGAAAYAATKASMVGFTRSLAREVGGLGITVNAVAPGFVDTEMTAGLNEAHRATIARRSALKRLPEADDVAYAVSYLMGERARNVTGTVLTVDAGNTA